MPVIHFWFQMQRKYSLTCIHLTHSFSKKLSMIHLKMHMDGLSLSLPQARVRAHTWANKNIDTA